MFEHFLTYIYESQPGLEEFEEKVDRIAEGEDDGDDSWISKIYNKFSFFNDDDNSLEENDMDGLEPPLLDETWGLGVRTHVKGEGFANVWCFDSFGCCQKEDFSTVSLSVSKLNFDRDFTA